MAQYQFSINTDNLPEYISALTEAQIELLESITEQYIVILREYKDNEIEYEDKKEIIGFLNDLDALELTVKYSRLQRMGTLVKNIVSINEELRGMLYAKSIRLGDGVIRNNEDGYF